MRQRHVADAKRRVIAQEPQVVVDHVATLDAHERRDLALGDGTPNVGHGGREHERVGMSPHGFAHGIDLVERALHGRQPGDVAWHPYREEDRVEAALFHPRDVQIAVAMANAEVEFRIEDEPLRRVGVRVDDDGALMDGGCLRVLEEMTWERRAGAIARAIRPADSRGLIGAMLLRHAQQG